jgi:hypothetical protein
VRRGAVAAAGLLVTLALAACGVGGTKAASSATTSSAATPSDTVSTGTGTGTGTATDTAGATGTGTSAGTTGTSTDTTAATGDSTATTSGATSTGKGGRKGHKGNGLPAAPAGLAQTAGFATYERCQGTCTGAVPATLRRPLKLPSDDGGPCPITLNAQPASIGKASGGLGFHNVSGSLWMIGEATWRVPASYTGPLLIRGEMLGGGALGFGTGTVPYDELQLLDAGRGAPRVIGGGRAWITYTRIRSEGCYAFQVDGTTFSEVLVIRAIG